MSPSLVNGDGNSVGFSVDLLKCCHKLEDDKVEKIVSTFNFIFFQDTKSLKLISTFVMSLR